MNETTTANKNMTKKQLKQNKKNKKKKPRIKSGGSF